MAQIRYTALALKALVRMPRNMVDRIRDKLAELAANPGAARNVKKLQGREGYRLRVGDWRVVYKLDSETGQLVVIVIDIGPRGGIYG
jgi:mRNA interferase RelE/StbE